MVVIYKIDKKCEASTSHPISLTCVCFKLLKYTIEIHIMQHAKNMSHFMPYNSFRDQYSCETQLLGFEANVMRSRRKDKQIW